MCLDAQGGIMAERQLFVVVGGWSCALLLYAFRVPCLTTILDFWSLECENTYTFTTSGNP